MPIPPWVHAKLGEGKRAVQLHGEPETGYYGNSPSSVALEGTGTESSA